MSVSEEDVRHIASLARLGMSDERVPALVEELNRILGHMDVLQRVDLSANTSRVTEVQGMPLRADVANAVSLARPREIFAPSMRDGFFLVPRLDTHGATSADTTGARAASEDEAQS